ncbi:MAG: sulfatase [Bacteroidota bacterium]
MNLIKNYLLFLLFLHLYACRSSGKVSQAFPLRPNVIYINIDDLGYKDLGFMGSGFYETPHLDALSEKGMVFTQGYAAAANCAPSRACLMTGLNTPKHKIYTVANSDRGHVKTRKIIPISNTLFIKDQHLTLAELFQKAGYKTASFGKWHISKDPSKDGFEENIGGTKAGNPGKMGYFAPYNHLPGLADADTGEYLTDRLTDEALHFIERNKANKFFLYLPYYAVHTPLLAKDSLIKKYEKKGGEAGQSHAVFAAMIDNLDTQIGRIMNTIHRLDLADKTLIIFTSDNGGIRAISSQAPLRAGKGSYYEGGIRVPYIFSWPSHIKAGSLCETPISNLDIFPTLANLLNIDISDLEVDGQDIGPLLKGEEIAQRDFFWHFPIYLQAYRPQKDDGRDPLFRTRPGSVIRSGSWKLHQYFEDGEIELYNLEEDLGERNNLADIEKAKAKELLNKLKKWQMEHGADIPHQLNPKFEAGFVPKRFK